MLYAFEDGWIARSVIQFGRYFSVKFTSQPFMLYALKEMERLDSVKNFPVFFHILLHDSVLRNVLRLHLKVYGRFLLLIPQ